MINHLKYNIHKSNDRQVHIQTAREYLSAASSEYEVAFMEVRVSDGINTFLSHALSRAKLPQIYYDKISLIIKNISEKTYNDTFLELGGTFNVLDAIKLFYQQSQHRVIELYIGVVDVLYVIFGRLPSLKSRDLFLQRYLIYSFLDILEDKFKYHTMYLVTSLIPPSTPPKGSVDEEEVPGIVIGGWVRRYFTSPRIPIEDKLKVAMSLQNAKRAAAAISERKQVLSMLNHQDNLLGKTYNVTESKKDIVLPRLLKKIDNLVKIYYPKSLEEEIPIWRLPSQSACFTHTRAGFGTMGALREKFYDKDSMCHIGDVGLDEDLGRDYYHANTIPTFTFGFDIDNVRKGCFDYARSIKRCEAHFEKVLEPFKVRGITASEPFVYQLGRLIQPVLHSHLRDEKGPFRFIGKRHNVADINDVFANTILISEETRQRLKEDGDEWGLSQYDNTCFVAGDFSNATDCMEPQLPKQFVASIKSHCDFSPDHINIMNLTLGSHRIFYTHCYDDFREIIDRYPEFENRLSWFIDQTHGQLMGSPLSFIVLCLVNAACLWVSAEIYRKRKLKWSDVVSIYTPLINGDDAAFSSNIDHYQVWREVCEVAGFALSPGKNYITDRFVNINSTNYRTKCRILDDNRRIIDSLEEEFLVNPGLLKGRAKVLSDSRADEDDNNPDSLMPVCDQLNECIRVANDHEKTRSYEVFKYHMEDRLKQSKRSWILPRHLGGLGLPFGTVTKQQLVLAIKLKNKYMDVSDLKDSGEFVEMSTSYFNQIKENLLPIIGCEEVKTKVLLEDELDPFEDIELFEKPSLSPCFMTSKKCFKNYDKKIILGKKKYVKMHPERKYEQALKKVFCKDDKPIWNWLDEIGTHDNLIKQLCNSRLSKSGLTKKVRVSLRKPPRWRYDYELHEDEVCRPWLLFN